MSRWCASAWCATASRAKGECVPYARYGETVEGVLAAIRALPADIGRDALQQALPAGAARNAVDCALWDWEAKRTGRPVWELAGLSPPRPVQTAYTLSLGAAEAMRAEAVRQAARPLLKVKLGGGAEDAARLRAVRAGAPDARIIVDANEGWSRSDYEALMPLMAEVGVAMIEQPVPAGQDDALDGLARPVPLCADESCHDRSSLDALAGRYDMVNVKLDKTGGLTEALALVADAEARGYGIMVGCMLATSLAMAPALLVAQAAEIVDLDGPLLLAEDREPPLAFDAEGLHPAKPALWG